MNLPYKKIGHGTEILLAFHGIGQDFSAFKDFAITFRERYTTLLFDLPFHGENQHYTLGSWIKHEQLAQCLENVFLREGIDRFSVIGFSMGGRFALSAANSFAHRLIQLILIAPDGVEEHPLFTFATRWKFSRFLFKKVILHPNLMNKGSNLLVSLKVLNPSVQRFSLIMLDTPAKKRQILASWIAFRALKREKVLIEKLNQYAIKTSIFIGRFDKLLPLTKVKSFHQQLSHSRLILLDSGHTRMIEHTTNYFLCKK